MDESKWEEMVHDAIIKLETCFGESDISKDTWDMSL